MVPCWLCMHTQCKCRQCHVDLHVSRHQPTPPGLPHRHLVGPGSAISEIVPWMSLIMMYLGTPRQLGRFISNVIFLSTFECFVLRANDRLSFSGMMSCPSRPQECAVAYRVLESPR